MLRITCSPDPAPRIPDPGKRSAHLQRAEPDPSVAGSDAKPPPAVAETASNRALVDLSSLASTDAQIVLNRAVPGVGVELGTKVSGQVNQHAPVACRDLPVVGHLGTVQRAIHNRSIASVKPQAGQLS